MNAPTHQLTLDKTSHRPSSNSYDLPARERGVMANTEMTFALPLKQDRWYNGPAELTKPPVGVTLPPPKETLEEMMGLYASGDESAFQRLHASVSGKLYGFFLRGGCNSAMSRDLTQQTFLRVHVARGRYHLDAPVLPWLFTIAYRVRIDEQRKRRRRPEARLDPEMQQKIPAPQKEEVSDRVYLLRQALHSLPEGQKQVILLHKFQGLTMNEVAKILGSSESAVKVRAHRAYKALRVALENLEGAQA